MTRTIRPRFVIGLLISFLVGSLAALIGGAGPFSAIGVVFALILAAFARQSLRLDEAGVRYRALIPSEGFTLAWSDVTRVIVDIVRMQTPGSPSSPRARARFELRDAPPKSAILFSAKDADRVAEVCRARQVEVLDERA